MNIAIKVITGIIALIIVLNYPVKDINTIPSVNPVYYYDLHTRQTLMTTLKENTQSFIYHKPLSGNYYSSYQYEVTKLGPKGDPELTFKIPENKDVLKSKSTAIYSGKDGYLTYPLDGSFFLWYPRLGNQTFFYDKAGEILWSRQNSHYLKAFPSGKYILSMTGDHSRAFYMLPDLSILGSSEGTLLINYQFSTNTKNNNTMQLCMGYLNGDIVLYNPHEKREIRVGTGVLTKSIGCDFDNLNIVIQNENPEKLQDEIRLGKIITDQKSSRIDWIFKIPLPERYIKTLPLGIQDDYIISLIPINNSIHMQAYDFHGEMIKDIKISESSFSNIEDWRIYPINGGLLLWNSHELHIYNPDMVFNKITEIENVVVKDNEIFVQTPDGIIAYEITNFP